MFQFKQFAIDQSGCAMKINTDGVLLGAMGTAQRPEYILDIGTGTGVIALMLAQRFVPAKIDAIEIDGAACYTAAKNFTGSKFAERLAAHHMAFEEYFDKNPIANYDLIVSNPPFYINSLRPRGAELAKAKHADRFFFEALVSRSSHHLSENGLLWLILPIETSILVKYLAAANKLFIHQLIEVRSYPGSETHRHIIAFSKHVQEIAKQEFVIYSSPKQYSAQYQKLLEPFFTIF